MTIIVATSWGGEAFIGGDRANTFDAWAKVQHRGPTKLLAFDWGALGHAGVQADDLLAPAFKGIQSIDGSQGKRHLRDAFRTALEAAGWKPESSTELPSCETIHALALSKGGKIFGLYGNQVVRSLSPFYATGSGFEIALGAAYVAKREGLDAGAGCRRALEAACALSSSCATPFDVWRIR